MNGLIVFAHLLELRLVICAAKQIILENFDGFTASTTTATTLRGPVWASHPTATNWIRLGDRTAKD